MSGAPQAEARGFGALTWLGLALAFSAVALVVALPALDGEFLSDDYLYIVNNVYVHGLSLENVLTILDPYGPPTAYTLNYAPVHLLLHAAEWELWGDATRGYHVVNAVAHGLTSLLLVAFFLNSGIHRLAALLGGAFFLVHPANLEVSAWLFQLKTIVSLALALGALLLFEKRPALSTVLFALACLAKISVAAALPVLFVQEWVRSRPDRQARWLWVGVWAVTLAAIFVPEMAAFQRQGDERMVIHEDTLVHARSIVSFAGRYFAMAATSWGISAFHEPEPALSWLDPWWLFGLAGLLVLGARSLWAFVNRREEAIYWGLAFGSFAPVSQVVPFLFPLGDRYLYGILPGLIGGVLLAGEPLYRRAAAAFADRGGSPQGVRTVVIALVSAVLVAFAVRSYQRAPVFVSGEAMMVDAALNYPDGMQANLLRGYASARNGDAVGSARAFQRAVELGFSDVASLMQDPLLARYKTVPAFRAMLMDVSRREILRLEGREDADQSELLQLAISYLVHERKADAIAALELAAERPGPVTADILRQLEQLRAEPEGS